MVARILSAGVTYEIESQVYNEVHGGCRPLLSLQNIKLTAPDQGLTDPPWPWEGTAIAAAATARSFSDSRRRRRGVFAEILPDGYLWVAHEYRCLSGYFICSDRSAHDDFVLTAYELKDDNGS